jgi:citrate lyase beta subunit
MAKSATLPCDAVILDLEDAVSPSHKDAARENIAQVLRDVDFGAKTVVVRVNAINTPWGRRDVASLMEWDRVDAVALPKVEKGQDLAELVSVMRKTGPSSSQKPIWAFIETAKGVLNSREIPIGADSLEALVVGCNDLTRDLNARFKQDRMPLWFSLGAIVASAKAHRLRCLDGVPRAVK